MTFQQLKYIVEIAKHNSISKAASALYVTQPSISKAVRELEAELGIIILDRTNKGVILTKEGMDLLFYAKKMMEQMDSVVHHFNKEKETKTTKISISSQHYGFAIESVAKLMEYLNGRNYEITVREGKTTDVMDDVYEGKSILGVLSLTELNKNFFERYFQTKSLQFTPIATIHQHVFLRKEHPLANESSIPMCLLKEYPYLTYQQDDVMLHFAEEAIDIENMGKLVFLKDRGAMNNLLANTNGFNIGTGCIVSNYMNPNITAIPLEEGENIHVGLVKRKDVFLPQELNIFIDLLKTSLEQSAPKNDRNPSF